MRNLLIIAGFFLICLSGFSQEVILELQTNPAIQPEKLLPEESLPLKATGVASDEPVVLPFLDDFSSKGPFPSAARWQDRFAFINTDYAVNPPNIGVATLDALNDEGALYPNAIPGPPTFSADVLTSRLIRLDSLFKPAARKITPADSVYFSFFYQPQGRGNPPESFDLLELDFGILSGDSVFLRVDSTSYLVDKTYYAGDTLLLPCGLPEDSVWVSVNPYLIMHGNQYMLIPGDQITLPCDSVFEPEVDWEKIWSQNGTKLDSLFYTESNPLSYFRRVMLPILDEKWYRPDFRFRFRNYVSLADNSLPSWQSNADHWNIDLVYLNVDRSVSDTTFKILSFVDRPPSFINQYESMPYSQYMSDPTNMMKDSLTMVITNLDTLIHNTSYRFVLYLEDMLAIDSCQQGNWDISPVYESGYLDYINFAKPKVCFGFFPVDFTADSAIFHIAHYLTTGAGSYQELNDTLWSSQVFSNYFAYDDGSAEAGYGLTPAGSELAYRFDLKEPDTLRAIQMYFNETRNGANIDPFYLGVWKDDNGIPGELIYSQPVTSPVYTKELNRFHTYLLDSAVAIASTFYVGWIQTSDDNLNIGFDRRNQTQQKIFYNVTGEWIQSIQEGSLMMRPVLGKPLVEKNPGKVARELKTILISPNPVRSGEVTIDLPEELTEKRTTEDLTLQVQSLTGQIVYNGPYRDKLNIDAFSEGLYILMVRGNPVQFYATKLMIIH
ncbi:MAG TPA: hypothetical protein PKI34_10580 [Bacteroidales bacterium]|nr:hypothetical protein [Bacteroidales bacterium]